MKITWYSNDRFFLLVGQPDFTHYTLFRQTQTYTHTHTHKQTNTDTHTHTHTYTLSHTHTITHTHTCLHHQVHWPQCRSDVTVVCTKLGTNTSDGIWRRFDSIWRKKLHLSYTCVSVFFTLTWGEGVGPFRKIPFGPAMLHSKSKSNLCLIYWYKFTLLSIR